MIDAHTHCYAGWIADPEKFAVQQDEPHWGSLHTGPRCLQSWPGSNEWSQKLIDTDLSAAVVLGWYWEQPQTCVEANRALIAFREYSPFPIYPFASIHPGLGTMQLKDELHVCSSFGFSGIGEIHPAIQGFSLDAPEWAPVFAFADDHGWPITIHVSEPLGRPHRGAVPTPLQPILHLAERHPNLKIILAHWGGLACFHELNPYVRQRFGNVHYDTAATTLLYDEPVWNAVLNVIPPEKIIFGSDYPLRPARDSQQTAPATILAQARTQLPPGILPKIFHDNILRLMPNPDPLR